MRAIAYCLSENLRRHAAKRSQMQLPHLAAAVLGLFPAGKSGPYLNHRLQLAAFAFYDEDVQLAQAVV